MKSTVVLLVLGLLLAACGDDASTRADFPVPDWAKVAPEQIAEAKKHGVPVAFENDLGMRFVLIPAGTFLMGSPEDEEGRDDDEAQHEVTISQPFYMQITEVTNGQYSACDGEYVPARSGGKRVNLLGRDQPVTGLLIVEMRSFTTWLADQEPGSSRTYRLPSEEEWEYACRAGTTSRFFFGDNPDLMPAFANNAEQDLKVLEAEGAGKDGHVWSAPVASYAPNPWGLYDMLGNVWEYCEGEFEEALELPPQDPLLRACIGPRPVLPELPSLIIRRGGSFLFLASEQEGSPYGEQLPRCAERDFDLDGFPMLDSGFRLVSPLPGERD